MSKNNGATQLSQEFLQRLEREAAEENPIFTQEKRNELHLILREHTVDLRKWIAHLSRQEQANKLMNAELTIRVVEFKIAQVSEQLEKMSEILQTRPYNKQTRDELFAVLSDAEAWLDTI